MTKSTVYLAPEGKSWACPYCGQVNKDFYALMAKSCGVCAICTLIPDEPPKTQATR